MNKQLWVAWSAGAVWLAACSASPVQPTPTPVAAVTPTLTSIPSEPYTPTVAATDTPTLTATLTLTPTALPTASPTPNPTPLGGSGLLAFTYYPRGYAPAFKLKGGANVFVARPDGSGLRPITEGLLGFNHLVGTSAAGDRVLVRSCPTDNPINNQNCHLFVVNVANSDAQRLDTHATSVANAVWHPNGKIAFIADDQLFLVNADGSELSQANLPPTFGNVPIYISGVSDKYVFFVVARRLSNGYSDDKISIWFMAADGSGQTGRITGSDNWTWGFGYKISPDGLTAAWAEGGNIYLAPIAYGAGSVTIEKDQRTALPFPKDDQSRGYSWLDWSPDSQHLWITIRYSGSNNKYTYHIWSATDSAVTDLPALEKSYPNGPPPLAAVWSPDGGQLLISDYATYTSILDLTTLKLSFDFGCALNPQCATVPAYPDYRNPVFGPVFWLPTFGK